MDSSFTPPITRIELHQLLPEIFAGQDHIESEVWHQPITLHKGDVCLVEAGSGKGKSSLCSYLYGYRQDYQGIINFNGHNIRSLTAEQWTALRRRHLSLMFQELRLFPELTAFENIWLKNKLTNQKSVNEIKQWFALLDLTDKWDTPAGKLSYGQQQRIALMRALCQPFDFILLDEPLSHIDDANARRMAELLMTEASAREAGVVVTSIGKKMDIKYNKIWQL